jgi:hypothetical protein
MAFTRVGYGQVEPNQLSAQKTGQIYASLPLDSDVKVLQNGEFMYYSYADGMVTADPANASAAGELMLVFNEIKLYEPFWRRSYKDFAMIRVGDNYVTSGLAVNGPIQGKYGDGAETIGVVPSTTNPPSAIASTGHVEYPYRMDGIAPRLFKTNVGDIYTTNMVKELTGTAEYAVGEILVPALNTAQDGTKTFVLEKASGTPTGMQWVIAKVYTMPDGQSGLKIQRIA